MEFFQYDETNIMRRVINWIVQIAVVIALAWFCVYAFGTTVKNAGQSMQPVLENGETALYDRAAFHLRDPERYDVIVFKSADGAEHIKRIIGMPGETVQIKNGTVEINGKNLETDNRNALNTVSIPGLAETPVELGSDEYFVLGDNRDSSEDSRFESIGNVKKSSIEGKVWIRVSPLIRLSLIH